MSAFRRILPAVFLLFAVSTAVAANQSSPLGYWMTIDDDGKTPTSIMHIYQDGATISGKVLKIIKKGSDPNALCVACTGELKDKPVVGMRLLWGMKKEGDEWGGGRILDPDSGKDYSCTMKVEGDKLHVRGYIGLSMFGRTQVWHRTTQAVAEGSSAGDPPAKK